MKLEIHYDGSDNWAALYIDGKLDPHTIGDSNLAEEKALELCGVTLVYDDSFMMGQKSREGVAKTLEQVAEYRHKCEIRQSKIQQLRDEAQKLLDEANRLSRERIS